MKKFNYNSEIFCICIVAILCYVFLNGHQIALKMQENEQYESISRVVSRISQMTGGEFVSRKLMSTVVYVASYDITIADCVSARVEEELETPPEQPNNIPEPILTAQESTVSSQADNLAPPAVAEIPTSLPTTAHTATQTVQGEQQPAMEIPPPVPAVQTGTPPKKIVEEADKIPSDKGVAENKSNAKRPVVAGKSIFANSLSHRYKVLLVGDSFMEDITLAIMRNY